MQCKICVTSHFSGRGDSHQLHNMNQMAAKRVCVCVCVLGRCGELYGEGQTSRAASFGREKQGFAVQRRKSEFTFTFLFLSWDLSSLSFINLSEAVRQILYCNVECRLAVYFIAEEREEEGREFSGDCLIEPVAEPTSDIQFPPAIAHYCLLVFVPWEEIKN